MSTLAPLLVSLVVSLVAAGEPFPCEVGWHGTTVIVLAVLSVLAPAVLSAAHGSWRGAAMWVVLWWPVPLLVTVVGFVIVADAGACLE